MLLATGNVTTASEIAVEDQYVDNENAANEVYEEEPPATPPPADTGTDTSTPIDTGKETAAPAAVTSLPSTGFMLLGSSAAAASLMAAGLLLQRRKR
jgi:LPXTG-motif cell wall-anchored protein